MPIDILHATSPLPQPAPDDDEEDDEEDDDDTDLPRPGPRRPRGPIPTGDQLRDNVFEQLDGMGWRVVVTVRCPFDAFSQGATKGAEEILLTAVGSLRSAQHRAELLQQIARVAEGHALYVVREVSSRRSIEGLPVLTVAGAAAPPRPRRAHRRDRGARKARDRRGPSTTRPDTSSSARSAASSPSCPS